MAVNFIIDNITLLKVFYSLNPVNPDEENKDQKSDHKEELEFVNTKLNCSTKYEEENKIIRVVLQAIIEGDNAPYLLDVEMGGAFELDSDPDPEELERLRSINCPALLFPYLREFISDLTKRGGNPPLYLPPVNFVKSMQKK